MGSTENQALPTTRRVPDSKSHLAHTKMDVIKKGHAKDSQRYKVDYESQSTDTQNFSSESKHETEYVRAFPLVDVGVGPPGLGIQRSQGHHWLKSPAVTPVVLLMHQAAVSPSYRRDIDPPLWQRSHENQCTALQTSARQSSVLTKLASFCSLGL